MSQLGTMRRSLACGTSFPAERGLTALLQAAAPTLVWLLDAGRVSVIARPASQSWTVSPLLSITRDGIGVYFLQKVVSNLILHRYESVLAGWRRPALRLRKAREPGK